MRLTVDRIEGNMAVCEQENTTKVDIPLADLPADTHEGSIIVFENGVYTLDKESEEERRAKLFALQNSIFDE